MHFALVGDSRQAAEPGLTGLCPGCGAPMVAKCGEQRLWHWAHRRARMCDDWWEPETEWHRAWKNQFDPAWQEGIRFDESSGEKHIADVLTEHGLVREFQHSALNPIERASCEAFHWNIVWVVDGTRLKRDFPRFFEATDLFERTTNPSVFLLREPEMAFPKSWLNSRVPVFFDFRNGEKGDMRREQLWCLLPGRANGHAVIGVFSPSWLVTGRTSPSRGYVSGRFNVGADASSMGVRRRFVLPIPQGVYGAKRALTLGAGMGFSLL